MPGSLADQADYRGRQRLALVLTIAMLGSLLAVLPSFAAAGISGTFESSDGDLQSQGLVDWNSLTGQGDSPEGASYNPLVAQFNFGKVIDLTPKNADNVYLSSNKHDDQCPNIGTKGGGAQNKGDFTSFYIAHELQPGQGDDPDEVYLYLAWTRAPQNTDTSSAHASFEFNQGHFDDDGNPILCASGGLHQRTAGDMLIVYDFEGGPDVSPTLRLSRWITTGSPADCETSNSLPCWNKQVFLPANVADAASNHREQDPNSGVTVRLKGKDFPTVYDAHLNRYLGPVEFGEAGIRLTHPDLNVFPLDECVSFGSAQVSSRTSGNSFNAELVDLVGPLPIELGNCGSAVIHKVDDDDNPVRLDGAEFVITPEGNFDGYDTEGDPIFDDDELVIDMTEYFDDDDLGGVFCTDGLFAGDHVVVETVAPADYDFDEHDRDQTVTVNADGSTCLSRLFEPDNGDLDYIDPDDQTPDLVFVNHLHRGAILVLKTDGADRLDGAEFAVVPDAVVGDTANVTRDNEDNITGFVSGSDTEMEELTEGVFCLDGLAFGDYVVFETEAPDGYNAAPPAEVEVAHKSECPSFLDAEDAPLEDEALEAAISAARAAFTALDQFVEFVNVAQPGRVEITKLDDDDNPLAGVVFELWTATEEPDNGGTVLAPDEDTDRRCVTIVDTADVDEANWVLGDCYEVVYDTSGDPSSGPKTPIEPSASLGFQNLTPGFYCVVEDATTVPAGHSAPDFDPDEHCFEIEITDGGDLVELTIENPRLHRVVVLVCHEGTDTFYPSDVTLKGETEAADVKKASLAAGSLTAEEQKALCDLGGASFGGLDHDDYDLEVEVGDH